MCMRNKIVALIFALVLMLNAGAARSDNELMFIERVSISPTQSDLVAINLLTGAKRTIVTNLVASGFLEVVDYDPQARTVSISGGGLGTGTRVTTYNVDTGASISTHWFLPFGESYATLFTQPPDNTTQVNNNTTNIGSNTTNIATNATNIGTNKTNIATNTTNIATNTTNISSNTTQISNLSNRVDANSSRIKSLDGKIDKVGALAAALDLQRPIDGKTFRIAFDLGAYEDEIAYAVTFTTVKGRFDLVGGIAFTSGETMGKVSAGFN